jgi:hypothetical protein
MGRALIKNRDSLVVGVTRASNHAGRLAVLYLIEPRADRAMPVRVIRQVK